ncbi:hypothetical protein BDF20DRAFT_913699 [Mycotypha africana]|uniref:uncharacterized protein n=1 Tax=Mycotypha africana TaxID=64632 RepID=UPI00230126EC|nr:uncharacterized protein BDF20DRAFT_913699 [Mycotypha africana]KAI8977364.1 hypothetical protein BDF20DRAFT_913699 [Mycotypha africana]
MFKNPLLFTILLICYSLTACIVVALSEKSIQTILKKHNDFRIKHHAPSLKWDTTLASYAQRWSNKCQFNHSGGPYGENLASGYRSWADVVDAWYGEVKKYDFDKPTGFSATTGHFTAVVWKSTTKIGCGVKTCRNLNGAKIYTCSYEQPGNICCGGNRGPKWKREIVKDHKFDYIDLKEFYDPSCTARIAYLIMYILILKGFLVYVADLWTAVIGNSSINADASIPPDVAKWIFLGAILISFVLLFWDIRKARGIIESRDISLNFFSVIANRWYSTKDYKYFCLFRRIEKSRKSVDSIAIFVFFTLKGWKKILLAEAPRQVINVVTLKTIIPKWIQINNGLIISNESLGKNTVQRLMTGTMIFSTAIFAMSFILLCAAAVIYLPVLCHIQGNLKEYCCHKVDKRIEEVLRKQARKRIEKHKQLEERLKNSISVHNGKSKKTAGNRKKKYDIEMQSLPQPTLPNLPVDTPYTSTPYTTSSPYSNGIVDYNIHQHLPQYHQYHYTTSPSPQHHHQQLPLPPLRRNNSFTSISSDQLALTAHAQGEPYSHYDYNHMSPSPLPAMQQQQHYYQQQSQQQYDKYQHYQGYY